MSQRIMSYDQSKFNELVVETMEEFEMEFEEAVEFSISQLEAQGVVTNMLLRDADIVHGVDPITKFCKNYTDIKEDKPVDVIQLTEAINCISTLVSGDIKMKLYAGKSNIQNMLIAICKNNPGGQDLLKLTLTCLKNLTTGYPDVIHNGTMDYLFDLEKMSNESTKTIIRSVLLESIKLHENNKAWFFKHPDAFPLIKSCIDNISSNDYCVGCAIIQNLSCDDDIREQVSGFYTRATSLADKFLLQLYQQLRVKHDIDRTGPLINAVTAMTVTNELVAMLYQEDPNFLIITEIIKEFRSHKVILSYAAKLMVALSGNDDCRNGMKLLIPLIMRTMDENIGSPELLKSLFLVTSSISLRSQKNALAFMELHAVEKIVQGMKTHNQFKLRKYGLMALRTLASSSKQLREFLDAGVEEFVNSLMGPDSELIQECKSTLIALGATVSLREQWSGKRGDIVGANEKPQDDSH